MLAFAVGYVAMSRHVTNAGAFYAYAARGLGGKTAGATAIVALLSYNAMQFGLIGLFGGGGGAHAPPPATETAAAHNQTLHPGSRLRDDGAIGSSSANPDDASNSECEGLAGGSPGVFNRPGFALMDT